MRDMARVHAFRDDALGDLDAVGLVTALHAGEVSVREAVEAAVARTEEVDPALGAVAYRAYDRARAESLGGRDAPGWRPRPTAERGIFGAGGLTNEKAYHLG